MQTNDTEETLNEVGPDDAEMSEDPTGGAGKKPTHWGGVLLLVLAVAGGGGGYLTYLRNGPASASAAGLPGADEQAAVSEFVSSGGGENIQAMRNALRDTPRFLQEFRVYPGKSQVPLADLRTNPFRQQQAGPAAPQASGEQQSRLRQDEERAAMLKAVEGLKLQSVIRSGTRRSCLINNTLYQEGQQVAAFTVEQINPQTVVVRSGMYRFELRME